MMATIRQPSAPRALVRSRQCHQATRQVVVALVLGEENARKTRFGTIEYRFFDLFKRSIESCLVLNIEFWFYAWI